MKRKSNNNGGGKRRNNKKRSKKSNVLVFILSITIFYRLVVVQRGVGRSFMTKHSRKEQLQSQFEYDPFAKDVDSYGVNVEDVDAPLAPESQTSSTSDASVLAALANASSSSYVPKQTKERAFYGERRDVFGHASWQPVQARLVDYAGATISVEGKFARRSFARAFAANNNNNNLSLIHI